MGVTQELAHWVAATGLPDVPTGVVHEAKRTFLNFLGLAIGGSRHEAVEILLQTAVAVRSPSKATVLGRGGRCGLDFAAMANGMAAHVEDFDDTHLGTVIHPGAPVAPAALALAEWQGRSGADFLEALILGCETELRVGCGICPEHFDRGWHLTATTGNFGAASAAGKMLGLDPAAMTAALGIAATQAAGLQEMLGTHCKSLHPGKAAANGLLAALLASRGFTSSTHAVEAKRGFASVTSSRQDYAAMTDGLGVRWELALNTYKPFACGIVSHPVLDAAITLRRTRRPAIDAITAVEVEVNPVVLDVMGKAEPRDGLESKFSVYHCAAVGLTDGEGGILQFTNERALDPRVVALRQKVTARLNPAIRKDECWIRVSLVGGEKLEHHVEHAVGSAVHPMSDQDLVDKFAALVEPVLPKGRVSGLVGRVWELERLSDMNELVRLSVS